MTTYPILQHTDGSPPILTCPKGKQALNQDIYGNHVLSHSINKESIPSKIIKAYPKQDYDLLNLQS